MKQIAEINKSNASFQVVTASSVVSDMITASIAATGATIVVHPVDMAKVFMPYFAGAVSRSLFIDQRAAIILWRQ